MKSAVFAFALCALAACGCSSKDDATLKMITGAAFPPYEFSREGEIVGIDVEICRALAAKLGKDFSCENADFDSVIAAVVSGKSDVAAAGITVTDERKALVDFSDPYITTGIVVIFKKKDNFTSSEELRGKLVGVQSGTTSEEYVVKKLNQEPMRFGSPAEAVAGLKDGRVDYVIADIDPAENCIKDEEDLAISGFVSSEDYAVAVRKGRPEFLKAVNATIAEIKADGRLAKWIEEYSAEAEK